MKRLVSLFLVLSLCIALNTSAFAVTSATAKDGDREIVFSSVVRVDTKVLKISRNGTLSEKEVNIYILSDDGATITATRTEEFPLLIFDYEIKDDVYTAWNMSDADNPVEIGKKVYDVQASMGHPTVISGIEGSDNSENDVFFSFESVFSADISNIAPETGAAAEKPEVIPTNQKLTVNGVEKKTEIYNINGSNYFKLRDMAALLNGTGSQFSVDWNSENRSIAIKTGAAYKSVGGELNVGEDKSASAVLSSQQVMINGSAAELVAYNIGGNNFFKLRDLGTALGFDVNYDAATATMIVTSK